MGYAFSECLVIEEKHLCISNLLMHLKNTGLVFVLLEVRSIYFRCMKVELHHLGSFCPDLDPGNVCPACPKVSMQKVVHVFAFNLIHVAESWYSGSLYGCFIWLAKKEGSWQEL